MNAALETPDSEPKPVGYLPDQMPTPVVLNAFSHALSHTHEDQDVRAHFVAALMNELGLSDREDLES